MPKLVIDDSVKVPVKFDINNKGKAKSFNFNVICTRLDQDEINAILKDDDALIVDVLKRIVTDWENQPLVVDDDNKSCEFSEESFAVMLKLQGIQKIMWVSYLKEVGAKVKNL